MINPTETLAGKTIGFIGVGAMGGALCQGLVKSGATSAYSVIASDANAESLARMIAETGVEMAASNRDLVEKADVIVLAVKPYLVSTVLSEVSDAITANKLVISIAAGLSTDKIERELKASVPLVRAMPNTGARVNLGATAFCPGQYASEQHLDIAEAIFNAVGIAVRVEERMMDAVTALSGSGPAYVFIMIDALADGGVKVGLPRATALKLAAQTVLGAASMVLETGSHPAQLRDMVATPAGTTIAGITALERDGFRYALIDAIEQACKRSSELGG